MKKYLYLFLLLFFIIFLVVSCKSSEIKNVEDAKESYDYAMKLMKSGRYVQARETFQEIKNKLPESSFAILSELRIADSYYEEESYIEAISSYEVFEELHPKHQEIEYVIYRIGLSYYNSAPTSIDRDLEPNEKAIKNLTRLIEAYPNSQYKEDATNKIRESRIKLLQREYYIGHYYFKRDIYKSSLERYENIYKTFPDLKIAEAEKAMYELYLAYGKLKDKENQERVKNLYVKEYPQNASKVK